MLLPQTKEREYRFRLALRIGLPIFALIFILVSTTLITTYESLHTTFYFTSTLLLAFSIYFIFFLIYRGFDVKITDDISKTFSREYLYYFLKNEIKKQKEYSLMLISVDNLNDINTKYGLKNGDKVLSETAKYIEKYLNDKNISGFPIGHIKAGDFVIGLSDKKENLNTILDLFCLKSSEFKINDIEVNISGALVDSSFSTNIDYLIEKLFEIQLENRKRKNSFNESNINPGKLESYVIDAIDNQRVDILLQDIYNDDEVVMQECFVKLINSDGQVMHPKSYIKVVNSLGLRAEYDYFILEKTIDYCFKDNNKQVAIVIDPTSLRNYDFLSKTKELIQNNENLKDKIVFIVSENEYYSNVNRFNATLQSLRKIGVKICIDRLGALHTSFLYLRELTIDMVRYDRYYTKDIQNESTQSVIDGFNTMADKKNVLTWLKMIENDETKELAQNIGLYYLQGRALSDLKKLEK